MARNIFENVCGRLDKNTKMNQKVVQQADLLFGLAVGANNIKI